MCWLQTTKTKTKYSNWWIWTWMEIKEKNLIVWWNFYAKCVSSYLKCHRENGSFFSLAVCVIWISFFGWRVTWNGVNSHTHCSMTKSNQVRKGCSQLTMSFIAKMHAKMLRCWDAELLRFGDNCTSQFVLSWKMAVLCFQKSLFMWFHI